MASVKYSPVSGVEEKAGSSQLNYGDNSSAPHSDSEDHDEALEELEAGEGYQLRELRGRADAKAARGQATSGAEKGDDDEDDEHEPALRSEHTRAASVQSFELYTPDEERRVRRKLDTHLVLFVALLYMLSFLDRSNIGNAKIAGLTDDLRLSDEQYEWLLTAFYVSYILFEWMTLMYQIVRPSIYISICVCTWGVLASLQSLASSWPYLLVLRALLGIGEAAFAGIPFYLTFFFRREELAFRTGIFIAAAPLATSFASSLAWVIVSLGNNAGIASWRLLFLVEGFPAVLVAVWCWWWVPDSPSTARWLDARERKIATQRLRRETSNFGSEKSGSQSSVPRHKKKFNWREVLRTLSDPKSYLAASMFFCCNVAFSSMPVFLPSIVHEIGYSRQASQGLSAPPFLFAFVVVLLTAYLSDRFKSRSIPLLVHALLAMLGYLFLAIMGALQKGHIVRYLAVYPICAGFFSAVTIVITWTVNNQESDEGKGTGMAVLNVIGQMGPLLGTRLYPDSDKPYYVIGMSVCAAAMALVGILAFALRYLLDSENARRKARWKQAEREGLVGGRRDSREFVYMT